MERSDNSTAPDFLFMQTANVGSQSSQRDGKAYLYVLIVVSFYAVFLFGIMLGYVRSKRREKRRSNIFRRMLHEEEKREWGAFKKKHSITWPAISGLCSGQTSLHLSPGGVYEGRVLSPLACALCSVEQSSISSLCSSADVHFAIEEESDSGTAESPDEVLKVSSDNSDDSSGLK